MNPPYDYLIVGSGLFGATFAHLARHAGKRCLVIEKRPHLGGNIRCDEIEGINVHRYGAHIFHTSDKDIWDFVNRLTPFNRFTNSPIAIAPDGNVYNLPFNMNTFCRMWGVRVPAEACAILEEQRKEAITSMHQAGATEPRNLEEQALCLVGRDVYEKLVKHYTEKQWGRKCSELPAFIIRRLPVRLTFDNNYFNDSFQGIPTGGYNKLIHQLLKGVECRTGIDFSQLRGNWRELAKKLVYTGPIDEYFDYSEGRLEWRTVRFETETIDTPNYQGNAVVNYTDAQTPWTRIIEHKHFESFGNEVYANPLTVISREYSTEYQPGMEPYYPVNDSRNNTLAQLYREKTEAENDVIFGGRLAEYRYYDMAPVIDKAFEAWLKENSTI